MKPDRTPAELARLIIDGEYGDEQEQEFAHKCLNSSQRGITVKQWLYLAAIVEEEEKWRAGYDGGVDWKDGSPAGLW